jgi:hypothetical protein
MLIFLKRIYLKQILQIAFFRELIYAQRTSKRQRGSHGKSFGKFEILYSPIIVMTSS